jgi:hypothetical protein
MVSWLINKGIVKDPAVANKLLIGVAVVCFALAIYFFI